MYDEEGRLASVISQLKLLDDDNLKENEAERVWLHICRVDKPRLCVFLKVVLILRDSTITQH